MRSSSTKGRDVHFLEDHGYAEDSVLFRDTRGHVHMLLHGFYDKFPGGHGLYSSTGLSIYTVLAIISHFITFLLFTFHLGWTADPEGIVGWEFSSTPAYGFEANLDGELVTLTQRERPQVVQQQQQDEEEQGESGSTVGVGALTHLFNGAMSKSSKYTFNMVTEICQTGPPTLVEGVPICNPATAE